MLAHQTETSTAQMKGSQKVRYWENGSARLSVPLRDKQCSPLALKRMPESAPQMDAPMVQWKQLSTESNWDSESISGRM